MRKCAQPAPSHATRANGSTGRAAPAPESAGHESTRTRSARSSFVAGDSTTLNEQGAWDAVVSANAAYEHVSPAYTPSCDTRPASIIARKALAVNGQ